MSQPPVTLRLAKPGDAPGLEQSMHQAYAAYAAKMPVERLPPMNADYSEEIASCPSWVAESNGVIVGGLILVPEDGYMTIANVAVRPDFQGAGLGRKLMDLAETEARRAGLSELRLATHVLLTENLSYYLHLGWTESGRDETRVYMRKSI